MEQEEAAELMESPGLPTSGSWNRLAVRSLKPWCWGKPFWIGWQLRCVPMQFRCRHCGHRWEQIFW